jgi:5'-3' exonuclease
MKTGYMLIDGNNIGYISNSLKPLSVGDQPTQAIYGFLRFLRGSIALYGARLQPIVLWDGYSWRYEAHSAYKASRDKPAVTAAEIQQSLLRNAYKKQTPMIKEAVSLLGVPQMKADNLEADDLAGLMVRKYAPSGKSILLITGDKDWLQLVQDKVFWYDPVRDSRVTAKNFKEKIGVENGQAFLDVKCLVGDTSDEISGVGGIGEKGAIEFINQYGSLVEFSNRALSGEIDVKALHKKFRALVEDESKMITYSRNRMLMDLSGDRIPKPVNFSIDKGSLDREGFKDFCNRYLFNSITKDLDGWLEPFTENKHGKDKAA